MGNQATGRDPLDLQRNRAKHERSLRELADRLAALEAIIRRNHPELITPAAYAQIRSAHLNHLAATRTLILETADFVASLEVIYDGYSRGRDSDSD